MTACSPVTVEVDSLSSIGTSKSSHDLLLLRSTFIVKPGTPYLRYLPCKGKMNED